MILQALYELAQRDGLVDDPDYEWKPVAHVVHLGADGRFLGVVGTRVEMPAQPGKKKSPPRAKDFRVPRRLPSRSGKNPPPEFMADNPLYVFGVPPRARPFRRKVRRRGRGRSANMWRPALGDRGSYAAAVVSFLDSFQTGCHPGGLTPAELSELPSNDVFAFAYEADGGALVTDRPPSRAGGASGGAQLAMLRRRRVWSLGGRSRLPASTRRSKVCRAGRRAEPRSSPATPMLSSPTAGQRTRTRQSPMPPRRLVPRR